MSDRPINVGSPERLAAGALAGALLVSLVRHPSPLKLIGLGCLLYRATRGHCYGYEWLGIGSGRSSCRLPARP